MTEKKLNMQAAFVRWSRIHTKGAWRKNIPISRSGRVERGNVNQMGV